MQAKSLLDSRLRKKQNIDNNVLCLPFYLAQKLHENLEPAKRNCLTAKFVFSIGTRAA